MIKIPAIIYDLETCNNYDFKVLNQQVYDSLITKEAKFQIIAKQSIPLEIGLLYVDDLLNPVKKVALKIKIAFFKPLDRCSSEQLEGLKFYFKHQLQREIQTSELKQLLSVHNKESKSMNAGINYFILFIRKYVGEDLINDKINNFMLIGKNNYQFDDLILKHLMETHSPHNIKMMFSNVFDLQHFIFQAKKSSYISVEDKIKYFTFPADDKGHKYTLSNIYYSLFNKHFSSAHDSLADVKATYKIVSFYIKKFFALSSAHTEITSQMGFFKGEINKK